MASLLAAESRDEDGSNPEVDLKDSKSGFYYPHVHHHVHMGLSLGAEHFLNDYNKVGDFYGTFLSVLCLFDMFNGL